MPHPNRDKVVSFKDFIAVGLHFPLDPFVYRVMETFHIHFHQLIISPTSFMKLAVLLWV